MRGEYEAHFTAGNHTRTFTFTVTTPDNTVPSREDIASIARAKLAERTSLPTHNWTLIRLVDLTKEIGGNTK